VVSLARSATFRHTADGPRWDRPYRAGRSSAKEKLMDICDRADGRDRPKEGVGVTGTRSTVAVMHGGVGYVMLPGMKQRIARSPFTNHVQTIVRPSRFGSAITASSGTTIHWLSRRTR